MQQPYRPAVSPEVHAALYDGMARRLQLPSPNNVVPDGYVLGAPVSWPAFAAAVANSDAPGHGVDCAWTVALAVDRHLRAAPEATCERFEALCSGLPHGAALPPLVRTHWATGHHYISFTLLVTVLERALYNAYARCNDGVKSNMILRDLLQSPELVEALPPGYLQLLRLLFFPSGLNLRNLVWHGFVAPMDFPGCFGSLLLVLLAEPVLLDNASAHLVYASLPLFAPSTAPLCAGTRDLVATLDLDTVFAGASVQAKARRRLVERSIDAFQSGQTLFSLFLSIPVLEYLVRCDFVRVNPSVPRGMAHAQLAAYYSTLDGFGQRSQHQVLLARTLFDSDADLNRLYETLSPSALAASVDLFMCAAGPNVRAKLCHGEVDLSTLWDATPSGTTTIDICAALVLLVLLERLCPSDHLLAVLHTYTSQFHPYAMLQTELGKAATALTTFGHQRRTVYAYTLVPVAPTVMCLEFVADPSLGITEAGARMCPTSNIPTVRFQTIPDGLLVLSAALAPYQAVLASRGSWFRPVNEMISYTSALPDMDLQALNEAIPSSTCMLAILDACQQHLTRYAKRVAELYDLLATGSARTSHRRSLLTNVLYLEAFESMLTVVVGLVEQLVLQSVSPAGIPVALEPIPRKLLPFVVSLHDDKKSLEKHLQASLQLWQSKALRHFLLQ
ncbi:hypothetical protein SDRG_12107 [Saprolegnia diclina VS20]|uniref:DUF4209 domain-containing protein n=1 Tax=Saprolegnia diclina (strain VS20) TaxID=1156394 RepID=T0RJZ6_SAPDV|nr:hypothetical protein SDRG_12107 [Saprolegnia diclina VS20]EQC30257.1 hypothetical protein SDRG_12107 [Saprolegnia diclina VS20]|eukprot:XP_008616389.1 hypothetical protein SDRG_12107 [Saprolegnia diclina VS20]